jgi:SAM-dependent methyltransferase
MAIAQDGCVCLSQVENCLMKLEQYRRRWVKKRALRKVYQDLYKRIAVASLPGTSLEVGAGIGNLELLIDNLVRLDIQKSPGVNVVADAHFLPFGNDRFSNVILFDVLHHLECPLIFLAEAERVLTPGGRVIMIEPGITPLSRLLYSLGHEEPVDMTWDPRVPCKPRSGKDPYESNQAIPTLLFKKYFHVLGESAISLNILEIRWLSLFSYPLSGGFKAWSLIPDFMVQPLLKIEDRLLPLLGRMMAFRLLIVLEKV